MRLSTESLIRFTEFSFPASFHFDLSSSLLSLYSFLNGLHYFIQLFAVVLLEWLFISYELVEHSYHHSLELFGQCPKFSFEAHILESVIFGGGVLSCFFILFLIMHGDVYVCH